MTHKRNHFSFCSQLLCSSVVKQIRLSARNLDFCCSIISSVNPTSQKLTKPSRMPTIRLQSSDGETFDTDVETAKCLGTIKAMLEEGDLDKGDDTVIPLPNVTAAILRKVLEWATHHKDDVKKVDGGDAGAEKRTDDISAWDKDFLKVDRRTVFELLAAACYLDAKELYDMACNTVANMIKGKGVEEIRKVFSVTNFAVPR